MSGSDFLRRKYNLHVAPEVDSAARREEMRRGETIPRTDADRLIQNYLGRFQEILDRPDAAKQRGIEALKGILHEKFVIKPENVPQAHFNLQGEIALREGRLADLENSGVEVQTIKTAGPDGKEQKTRNFHFPDALKKREVDIVIANQTRSLDKWITYLSSPDAQYPDWAKYWAMNSVLEMGKLQKKEGEDGKESSRFQKRTASTVASFPPLNPRALALTIGILQSKLQEQSKPNLERQPVKNASTKLNDAEFQMLLSTENFSKLYAQFLIEMPEYSTEGLRETRGVWVKYKQDSDAHDLVKSLEGHPLEWCTADYDTANTHLQGGDFHVYYSLDSDGEPRVPRLAIRMEGERIAEPPRGIAPDQNLDPYIALVLEEKLAEFGTEGEAFAKRASDMKYLTSIEHKTEEGEALTPDDLRFLYEIDSTIEGFGNHRDPRIANLRSRRNPEGDMTILFDCTAEQIAHSAEEVSAETKAYVGPLSVGLFDAIPDSLEHIYTSFPEGRIRLESLEIGKWTAEKLLAKMQEEKKKGTFNINSYSESMMQNKKQFIDPVNKRHAERDGKTETLDLVRLRVRDLGFTNNPTTSELLGEFDVDGNLTKRGRIHELGFEFCPPETGPYKRLADTDQPLGDWYYIGMQPVTVSDGSPDVFRCRRLGGGAWLGDGWAGLGFRWDLGSEVVLRRRKSGA